MTVIFLCGLIGSGKTTYAAKQFKAFTDFDYMPIPTKTNQINWTFQLLKKFDEVCHVTCFPTKHELAAFRDFDKRFLWMNTPLKQSNLNILKRKRPRDMIDINRVFKANMEYSIRFRRFGSVFELINNYGKEE